MTRIVRDSFRDGPLTLENEVSEREFEVLRGEAPLGPTPFLAGLFPATFETEASETANLLADEIATALGRRSSLAVLHYLLASNEWRQPALAALLGQPRQRTVRVLNTDLTISSYLRLLSRLCRDAADQIEQEAREEAGPEGGLAAWPRITTEIQGETLSDDPYPEIPDGDQPGHFSLSSDGIHFIKRHEGSRRKLYNDSQGHCTIGVGHLVHKGKCDGSEPDNFRRGLTEDEVTDLLRADLAVFEQAVQKNVTSRLNQYQYDALVSFSFNVGSGAFKKSGVLKEVNAKNYSKVPDELMKWLKPPEIKGRRTDEATLFRSGKY
jgi:lysozyme